MAAKKAAKDTKSSARILTTAVPPPPAKGKRKRFEKERAESVEAPSLSPTLTTSQASPVTRDSIRKLVESRIVGEVDDSKGEFKRINVTTNREIDTRTLGGWCLVDALLHCAKASNGVLVPLILKHGPPKFYLDYMRDRYNAMEDENKAGRTGTSSSTTTEDYPSFRALCRTVAGQQLAGAAAETIWRRLVNVVAENTKEINAERVSEPSFSSLQFFTPEALLTVVESKGGKGDDSRVQEDYDKLRKPAGLSRAKCDCIVEIARSFQSGSLSEAFLTQPDNDETIRERLLSIKGLGPWSVDMFLMFRCHRSNVLPIGDLALRNGTAVLWKTNKTLCAKKDAATITKYHSPFEPYRSISSYYMYKVADATKKTKKSAKKRK